MAIKGKVPNTNITLNNAPLEWVTKFTYLGVTIDRNLTFTQSVTYLRGRASARMAPMRIMASTQLGAGGQVLQAYYCNTLHCGILLPYPLKSIR